jgi:hypothetical protein
MSAFMVVFAYPALEWTLMALIILAGTPVYQAPGWESGGDYGCGEIRLAHLWDGETLAHEANHRMEEYYGMGKDWAGFEEDALAYLNEDQAASFLYYCSYGAQECHAWLPIILQGCIPAGLAEWYPYLRVGSCPEPAVGEP